MSFRHLEVNKTKLKLPYHKKRSIAPMVKRRHIKLVNLGWNPIFRKLLIFYTPFTKKKNTRIVFTRNKIFMGPSPSTL